MGIFCFLSPELSFIIGNILLLPELSFMTGYIFAPSPELSFMTEKFFLYNWSCHLWWKTFCITWVATYDWKYFVLSLELLFMTAFLFLNHLSYHLWLKIFLQMFSYHTIENVLYHLNYHLTRNVSLSPELLFDFRHSSSITCVIIYNWKHFVLYHLNYNFWLETSP